MLVRRVCQTVMERQRYFVVEQPWSAESWRYDGVLAQLWQREDVWLVRGEQRAYEEATGAMTNSQIITNQVARQRSCTVEHQPLMGNYKFGSKAKQAPRPRRCGSTSSYAGSLGPDLRRRR